MLVTLANLKFSGNKPFSNILLNIRDRGKEIGEDIIDRNLPGTPQYDWCDF